MGNVASFAKEVWDGIVKIFGGTPESENETLKEAERRAEEERLREEKEAYDRKMEAERQARETAEREARAAEERAAGAAERERLATEMEQRAREREEEARRAEEKAKQEAQNIREEAERVKEEARKLREEAQVNAERAKEEAEKAKEEALRIQTEARAREAEALRREQAAVEALERGVTPVKWPTAQEIATAKAAIRYNPELLHFAICGTAGSGKSTLINALRGLKDEDKNAATVGIVETTSKITRYPDARTQYPYARFVWYDIPGAGTLNVPDWQYFIDQGLFVFDFIVMAYDVRFTKIDLGILENCRRFRIPVFVVRSKADQHIRNMANSAGYDEDEGPYKPWYEKFKPKYVSETRMDFARNLQSSVAEQNKPDSLPLDEMLYIISSPVLRGLVATREDGMLKKKDRYKIIDEEDLVMDMLKVAARRRYGLYDGVDHSVIENGKRAGKRAVAAGVSLFKSLTISNGTQEKEQKETEKATTKGHGHFP